jgi:FHA domain-containing protein
MPIQIAAVSLNNSPIKGPLSHSFTRAGGTIGRANNNQLILDDAQRTVSRIHAAITWRDAHYILIDRGSNAIIHNGRPIGAGNEVALKTGDRLVIGSFELQATIINEPLSDSVAALSTVGQIGETVENDPFADLLAEFSPPGPAKASLSNTGDLDLLGVSPPTDPLGFATDGPGAPVSSPRQSIDDIFDLHSSDRIDPFALSPFDTSKAKSNTSGNVDPLVALGAPPPIGLPTQADHLPALQHAYIPPATRAEFISSETSTTMSQLSQPKPTSLTLSQPSAPNSETNEQLRQLLLALQRGLQMTHQPPQQLTPEFMEKLGLLLRLSIEGSLHLLHSRQELKRELRTDVTMIAAVNNNPLKFSPTVEVALGHLLGDQVRGFMQPKQAIQETFNDLKAHQLAVMVGMRSAITQVLERMRPEALEAKISSRSKLDAVFSANRKAKLWDQFVEMQTSISREAEQDFHTLFGAQFVKTYDEQMVLLRVAAKAAEQGRKSGSS